MNDETRENLILGQLLDSMMEDDFIDPFEDELCPDCHGVGGWTDDGTRTGKWVDCPRCVNTDHMNTDQE
ncbi:MAG: hypothetical protein H3C48_18175 [Chitinophagaceae bacterium]|nr:hypothetical protein [Chitinophagaceae bacterium]